MRCKRGRSQRPGACPGECPGSPSSRARRGRRRPGAGLPPRLVPLASGPSGDRPALPPSAALSGGNEVRRPALPLVGTRRRANRRPVGAHPPAAPAAAPGRRPAASRSSDHPRRDPLGPSDRLPLARDAGTLRQVGHGLRPVPALAPARALATDRRRAGPRCLASISGGHGDGRRSVAVGPISRHPVFPFLDLVQRKNSERFSWEANPSGLPPVPTDAPTQRKTVAR